MSLRTYLQAALRDPLGTRGTEAVEFAIVAPVLLLIVLGMLQFGLTMDNYLTLSETVRAGARQFALSRGDPTPYTDTVNLIKSSAPQLTASNLTITLSVSGTPCAADTACTAALTAGAPASVSVTYPCSLLVMGTNFAPSCVLSAQTTERVE